jgi:predicted nucleotidyltransferase
VATRLRYRRRIPLARVELEDPEVLAGDVHRDVVDGRLADRASERTGVRVPVQREIRPEFGDRRGEALAAEERPDPLGLSVQRVRRRRVVEEHDPQTAVRDLLQAALEGGDLLPGLRVHPAEERLAEVGQRRARKATDEALGTRDADKSSADVADVRVTVEDDHAAVGDDRGDFVPPAGVEIVVAEHREHGRRQAPDGVREHRRLVGLSVRRQVAREQDQVGVLLDLAEGAGNVLTVGLGAVEVAGRGDADRLHAGNDSRRGRMGNPPFVDDADFQELIETMKRAGAALRDASIPFMLGGGLAVWARGGARTEHDVDFLVKPEDAERAQEALAAAGMRPERPPEGWLLKAWDGEVLVDLIFEPIDGPVTQEQLDRADELNVMAMTMKVARLEDVMASKLLALKEQEPDFGQVIELARSCREQIDWEEVRGRTESSAMAKAFFTLVEELGVAPRAA